MERRSRRALLGICIALFGPPVLVLVFTTLMFATGWSPATWGDWMLLALAVSGGIAGIHRLPLATATRVGLAVIYVPVVAYLCGIFFLVSACALFKACL